MKRFRKAQAGAKPCGTGIVPDGRFWCKHAQNSHPSSSSKLKNRPSGGFLILAVVTVCYEPVFNQNSLIRWENTGKITHGL